MRDRTIRRNGVLALLSALVRGGKCCRHPSLPQAIGKLKARIRKMDNNIKTRAIPVDEVRIPAHEALAAMTA